MDYFSEIKTALQSHPPENRLELATALAAQFANYFAFADKQISAGYVRKIPQRNEITLTEIINGPKNGRSHCERNN